MGLSGFRSASNYAELLPRRCFVYKAMKLTQSGEIILVWETMFACNKKAKPTGIEKVGNMAVFKPGPLGRKKEIALIRIFITLFFSFIQFLGR